MIHWNAMWCSVDVSNRLIETKQLNRRERQRDEEREREGEARGEKSIDELYNSNYAVIGTPPNKKKPDNNNNNVSLCT